eukprot:jgi/Bigna1/71176/fgenesh1_pg.14_\
MWCYQYNGSDSPTLFADCYFGSSASVGGCLLGFYRRLSVLGTVFIGKVSVDEKSLLGLDVLPSGQQRQPWPCLAILALAAGIALTTTGPSTGASRIRPILTIKSTRKLRMKKLMTKDSLKPERQAFDYALSQDSDEPEQTRFMSDRLLEEAPESGSSRSGAKRTQPSLLSPSEPSIGSSLMQKLLPTLDLAREPKLDIKPMTSEPIPEHINSDSIEEAIELEQKKKKKKTTKKSKRKVQKGEGPPFSERSSNVKPHDDAFRMKEDETSKKRGLTDAKEKQNLGISVSTLGGQQVEDAEEAAKADDGSELQQRRVKEDAARFFERLLKEAEQEKKEEGSPMDDNEQDIANEAQDDDDENDTAARLSLGEIALSSMVQGLGDNALQNEEDLIGKLEKEEEELREKENEIQKKEEKEYLRKMEENMRKRIAEQLHKKEEEEQQQQPFGPGRHVKIFDDDDDDDDDNAAVVARIAARLAQNNDVEGSFPPSPFSPENQQKQSKRRDGEHGQGEREEDPKEKRGVQRGDNQPSMPPPPSNEEEHQQQNELGTQWEEAEPEEGGELRGNPGGEKDGYYYYYMNGNNRSKEVGGGAEEYINDEELQELERQMQQQPEDDDAAKRAVEEDGGDDDEYMYAYQYFDPEKNQTVVVSSPDQLKMMQNQSYTYENIDYDEYLRRYGAKEGDGMADNIVATTTTTNNSIKEQAADSGEAPADDIANAREELDLLIFKQRMQKAAEKREKREKEEERRRRRERQKRAPERGWLNSPFNEDTDNDGGDDDDSRAGKMRDHHGGEQGGKNMLTAGVNAVIDQDNSQPDEEERAEILAESRQFSRIMKRSSKRERKAEAKRLSFIRNERRLARKRRIEAGELNVTQSSSGDDDADEVGQQKQGGKNLPMSFDNGNEKSSSSSSSSSGDSSKDDKEPVVLPDQVPISPWAEYTPEQRRIAREKRRAAKLIKKQAIEQAKREKELQDMSTMLDDKLVSLRIYTENEDKAAATKILDGLIPLQRANKTSIFQAKCMLRCANNLRMWDYSQKIMQLLPHKEAMTWWLMPGEEDIERPASLLKPKARASSDINSWLQLLKTSPVSNTHACKDDDLLIRKFVEAFADSADIPLWHKLGSYPVSVGTGPCVHAMCA